LQWEYNQALAEGSTKTEELIQEQMVEYQKLAEGYEQQYNSSTVDLQKILA
jgi:hypothetical protein